MAAHRTYRLFFRLIPARALLGALTGLIFSLPALGEPDLNQQLRPLEGEPLQMRTLENPPLAYTGDDGTVTGVLVDGIREAARRTGHDIEFKVFPWKRVLAEVSKGNADAAFNAGITEERKAWGHYHDSVLIDETYVFFASEPKTFSAELEEAPDLRVGIQLGYFYGARFDQMLQDPPFRALEVSQTIPRNLRLLQADRIDVFIGDLLPTLHYLKEMDLEDKVHIVREKGTGLPLVVSVSPTYVAFSRRRIDPGYVTVFNKALESVKDDGTFDSILRNYQLSVPDMPGSP